MFVFRSTILHRRKKMRKKIISIILLVAMVLTMAAGCGKKEDKKDYFVFYVNNELTKVVAKKITLQHTSSGKAQVKELLKDLQTQPEDATLRRTIPRKVKIQNIDLISYQITVDFSKEYYDMKPTEEILTRAAIAKTLLQLSQYVTFTVDGKPLVDASGANVGAMNLDSFVENPGEQINSSQKATLKLYFSNKAGTRPCLLYTSDAADEKDSGNSWGGRIT